MPMIIYSIEGLAHETGSDAGLIRRMVRTGRLAADVQIQGSATNGHRPGWREGKPLAEAVEVVREYVALRMQLTRPVASQQKGKAKKRGARA